jgi:ATP adenylyltransferase
MVLSQRHIAAYTDLTETEAVEMAALSRPAVRVLEMVMAPDGFNIGMNLGQGLATAAL